MAAGWGAEGHSVAAEIMSLGRRPMSTHTCVGYAGPTAHKLLRMIPLRGR